VVQISLLPSSKKGTLHELVQYFWISINPPKFTFYLSIWYSGKTFEVRGKKEDFRVELGSHPPLFLLYNLGKIM
jgi:hypothetical protein